MPFATAKVWCGIGLLCAAAPVGCDSGAGTGEALPVRLIMGQTGQSPGQLVYPRAIDADSESIWVIDKSARVQRYGLDGEVLASFPMPESEAGKPTGLTIGPGPGGEDALYIADTHYHRVLVYEVADLKIGETPRLLGSFGTYGTGRGDFVYPTDVALKVGSDGLVERIYVSEYGGNDRISVFDASHSFLFSFGSLGDADMQFNRPQSLGIDSELDELIVTDACNHRIGRFTLDGELIAWIGEPGAGAGSFAYPYGLALPGNGTAMVSEFGHGRVQHVNLKTGESLGLYGEPGRGEGQLMNPWGVAIVDDLAYVLNSGCDEIVSFKAPPRAREVRR